MEENQKFLNEVEVRPFDLMNSGAYQEPDDNQDNDDNNEPPSEPNEPNYQEPDIVREDEDNESEPVEVDDSDYSASALLLQSYISDGLNYDGDINPNLSSKELLTILRETTRNEVKPEIESELAKQGYNDEFRKSIEFLKNGGTLEDLQASFVNQSYSQLDIEDDIDTSNRELVIKAYYKDKGIPEDKAERLFQIAKANNETYEEALEAQSHFEEKDNKVFEAQREAAKAQEELDKKTYAENMATVDNILKERVLGDIEITDKEAKEIRSAIYEPTELVEYTDENGKKRQTKVTKYEMLINEYNKNPEWQLTFTKLLLDGFKFNKVANKVARKRDEEINDVLNSKISRTMKKAINKNDNNKHTGTYNESTYVGEYNIK